MSKRFDNAMTIIHDKGWDFKIAIIEAGRKWITELEYNSNLTVVEIMNKGILTDDAVLSEIERDYPGGLIAFLRDGTYI